MEYDVKYDELLHKDDIYITFSQIAYTYKCRNIKYCTIMTNEIWKIFL